MVGKRADVAGERERRERDEKGQCVWKLERESRGIECYKDRRR